MNREIVSFHQDNVGDWVAALSCAHNQHVRHKPPFTNRPWVMTAAGREAKLGEMLDCLRCDREEWPSVLVEYKRTPEFTESTVPAGLTKEHTTKKGVWGLLEVTGGLLHFVCGRQKLRIKAGGQQIIVPEVPHHIVIDGTVTFHVSFWKKPDDGKGQT